MEPRSHGSSCCSASSSAAARYGRATAPRCRYALVGALHEQCGAARTFIVRAAHRQLGQVTDQIQIAVEQGPTDHHQIGGGHHRLQLRPAQGTIDGVEAVRRWAVIGLDQDGEVPDQRHRRADAQRRTAHSIAKTSSGYSRTAASGWPPGWKSRCASIRRVRPPRSAWWACMSEPVPPARSPESARPRANARSEIQQPGNRAGTSGPGSGGPVSWHSTSAAAPPRPKLGAATASARSRSKVPGNAGPGGPVPTAPHRRADPRSSRTRSPACDAARSPPFLPNAPNPESSRSASPLGDRCRTRAAASSMASGSPSRRRQIRAMASSSSRVNRTVGAEAAARSRNSCATAASSTGNGATS